MTDGTQDKPVDPMDDWASALAEQTSAEQATSAAAPAPSAAAPT
ncbi:Flagellar motor switch FliN, partial [Cupriavidus sp. HMR-1]